MMLSCAVSLSGQYGGDTQLFSTTPHHATRKAPQAAETGGLAQATAIPVVTVPGGNQPRTAVGVLSHRLCGCRIVKTVY